MNIDNLKSKILNINGKGYKSYKDIKGKYEIEKGFYLNILHVQGDPFASPTKINLIAKLKYTQFPENLYNNNIRRIAFQDYILRKIKEYLIKFSKPRGSGKSGFYFIHAGGQEIIFRSGCEIIKDELIIRFFCGLPAFGRKINAKAAIDMLTKEIPSAVKVLKFSYHNNKEIYDFVNLYEDIEYIRSKLEEKKLIAFIGNNSILPRKSGIEETPLTDNPVPFKSPKSMEVEFKTLHHGIIKGMGIPEGVTLIIGGGFHGKSTLLNAISKGIYPHIAGDGREWVITHPKTVKVRSEDGRAITGVNISPFINDLPMNKSTSFFKTENASGSTSIAANIIEALEVGAKVLLLDEDTTATNFLIRDFRIQKLIPKDKEPITPFIDKVKKLYEEYKVSTIIVIGGCGDYLAVADKVISLENYKVFDKTEEAKKIISEFPIIRKIEGNNFGKFNNRKILTKSFNLNKVKIKGKKEILLGKEIINLTFIEQIIEETQTRFIAEVIKFLYKEYSNNEIFLYEAIKNFERSFKEKGFKTFNFEPSGDLAISRIFEISAAINRYRKLIVKSID